MKMTFRYYKMMVFYIGLLIVFTPSCKKLVEVGAPPTSLNGANMYSTDATAASVLTGIYTNISENDNPLPVDGDLTSITLALGLSSDELTLYDINNSGLLAYYSNNLDSRVNVSNFWTLFYGYIFQVNSAIEGLNASNLLTPIVKQQLLGEAYFLRAMFFFYLTNLYGNIPLTLTSDYKVNASISQTESSDVYGQIIKDLKQASSLLSENYLQADAETAYPIASAQRVRPTKWAAQALLARTYLFMGDYPDAEQCADSVIGNTNFFSLDSLNGTFLANSDETIWAIQPVNSGVNTNTGDGALFILPPSGPNTLGNYPVFLSSDIVNSFEPGDLRRANWIDSVVVGYITYYFPFKYKIGAVAVSTQEYIMVLRVGEQFLIRAEARARQGKVTGPNSAASDLNTIRARAGLSGTSASNEVTILQAILHERQVELFTEWGHRWFDMQRFNVIGSIMDTVSPKKDGTWSAYKALFPIPLSEITLDPHLIQNSGYN